MICYGKKTIILLVLYYLLQGAGAGAEAAFEKKVRSRSPALDQIIDQTIRLITYSPTNEDGINTTHIRISDLFFKKDAKAGN